MGGWPRRQNPPPGSGAPETSFWCCLALGAKGSSEPTTRCVDSGASSGGPWCCETLPGLALHYCSELQRDPQFVAASAGPAPPGGRRRGWERPSFAPRSVSPRTEPGSRSAPGDRPPCRLLSQEEPGGLGAPGIRSPLGVGGADQVDGVKLAQCWDRGHSARASGPAQAGPHQFPGASVVGGLREWPVRPAELTHPTRRPRFGLGGRAACRGSGAGWAAREGGPSLEPHSSASPSSRAFQRVCLRGPASHSWGLLGRALGPLAVMRMRMWGQHLSSL